jgi:hypothetical protein
VIVNFWKIVQNDEYEFKFHSADIDQFDHFFEIWSQSFGYVPRIAVPLDKPNRVSGLILLHGIMLLRVIDF